MSAWIGVDVGGTFTDVIVYSDNGDKSTIAKVPSTPLEPGRGLVDGISRALSRANVDPSQVTTLVHGSTVGTNAVLEKAGARVGIITTAGFEDTLYIGRAKRTEMYDLMIGPETPYFLCPRRRVRGVPGRMGTTGDVVDPLDTAAVIQAADELVNIEKVESIAVCLMMSFISSEQEEHVEELIRQHHPDLYVSLSSRVDPRVREYERLVATALDAYIRPKMSAYIGGLRKQLEEVGIRADLQVMESHGGVVDSSVIEQRAVGTLLSGLAGGAIGAAATGEAADRQQLISFDMGGTSTDVTLIVNSRPLIGDQGRVGSCDVRLPMVDVHAIGAGGGSLAYVDASGGLRVGPHSAGADPGPAAYGQGGAKPTVTDAAVLLGFLGDYGLAGGSLNLNYDLAEEAIRTQIAEPMGISTVEAAWGIHRIAVAAMAAAVRVQSVGRGHDPRRFSLLACGGAGPLHACGIAEELGITEILVPPYPGVLSAYGLLAADAEMPQWRTFHARLGPDSQTTLQLALNDLDNDARNKMAKAGVDLATVHVTRSVSVRYVGQSHELRVDIDSRTTAEQMVEKIRRDFDALHHQLYGQRDPDGLLEVTAVHAVARAPRSAPAPGAVDDNAEPTSTRAVYVPQTASFADVPSIPRGAQRDEIQGPAIITQEDTTTLVSQGWTASTDPSGCLLLSKGKRPLGVDNDQQ